MASPPSYTDPSVADDISSLLGTVHVVRVTLLNAMKGLEGVDEINGVNLLCLRLRELDERFSRLSNESRTSANRLYAAIQEFLSVTITIALDTHLSAHAKVEAVKESADKIARSAREDLRPYDERVDALKNDLQSLHVSLVGILDHVKKDKEQLLTELTKQGSGIGVDNMNLASSSSIAVTTVNFVRAIVQDTITKLLASLFSGFSVLKPKQPTPDPRAPEIAALKNDIASTTAEFDSILETMSSLVQLVSGLVGKLGHFGAVWDKLAHDSAQLSIYLDTGNDQDEINNRVRREIGVYEKIKTALDEYRIGV